MTKHTSGSGVKYMVLGFAFTEDFEVALIHKKRPEWQSGSWNGVGGGFEKGETAFEAMQREFNEETGVLIPTTQWISYGRMTGPDWHVELFTYRGEFTQLVKTMTDEEVAIFDLGLLDDTPVIPNLPILIGAAQLRLVHGVEAPELVLKYAA